MTAAANGPFSGCYDETDGSSGPINHPGLAFTWLDDGLAYSDRSVIHIIYLTILFTLAAISRAIFKRTSSVHGGKLANTSHVLILILSGISLQLIVEAIRANTTGDCFSGAWMLTESKEKSKGDIAYLYFLILPILLFKPSFDVDFAFVLRNFDVIIIFSSCSMIAVMCFTTMFIVTSIEPFREIALDSTDFPDYGEFRSFALGGILAIIVSLPDSSLMLGLLKEIGGKNNRLSNILDNGTWVATCLGATIFEILRISVQSTETWAHGTWIWAISWKLIVSPLVGFLIAKVMGKFLGWIINDALAEALLVYSTVFSTFAMCNLIGLSGPIAILVFNIFFDHSQLSREAELSIKKFSNVMTFFAGVYLSGTAGYVWLEQALKEWGSVSHVALWKDVFWIFILYLFVMSIRLVVLQSTAYLLRTECIRWREAMLISLGEVRGHVNILLAFIVLNDPELSWTQHDCTETENRFNPANPFLHSRATFIPNYGACAHDIYDISVAINSPISAHTNEYKLSELYQIGTQKIFFYGMGVLILTQVINASLLEKCTSMLGIYQISSGQRHTMSTAITKIKADVAKSVLTMRYDPFLTDADWELVQEKSTISYPYKKEKQDGKPRKSLAKVDKNNEDSMACDLEEARQRALNALKTSFANQRNCGLIPDDAVTVLNQAVNSVQDEQQSTQIASLNQLKRNWKVFGFFPKLASMIDGYLYNSKERIVRNPWRKQFLRKCHRAALSDWYEWLMQAVILANMAQMIIEGQLEKKAAATNDWTTGLIPATSMDNKRDEELSEQTRKLQLQSEHCGSDGDQWELVAGHWCASDTFQLLNLIFLFIYILDVVFKSSILSVKEYWTFYWNRFDLAIVVVSVIETIVSYTIDALVKKEINNTDTSASNFKVVKVLKVLKFVKIVRSVRSLRSIRMLRFSKSLVPLVMKWINNKIYARMSFGYDVGRGFIKGCEELDSALDMIAGENYVIKRKLSVITQKSRTLIIRDLGMLQKNYPGIATSVKTRTAIRNLINVMFDSTRRLQSGGVLDDFEVRVLHDQINILVKNLARIPIVMKQVPPESLFLNITWVNGDRDLGDFLIKNSIVCDFDLGDLIVQDDEEPDSIFLIINGLVKIVHGNLFEDHESSVALSAVDSKVSQQSILDSNVSCDYASTGLVVGELGCLIGESAGISVICETSVSTYQIPVETIRLAFEKFPKLKDSLWKVVALKIAVPMMQKEFKWQGFSSDEIRLHLQSGRIMTFSSGEEFKMGPTIADCFLVDGAVIHSGELIGSPAIINHVQLSDGSAFDDGQEVEESVCAIPERAVLLVVKRKHEGKGIAIINNRTSMTSQLSKGMSTVRPRADVTHAGRAGPSTAQHKKRTQGEITRESRTSFNTVIVDTARREYMASKLANGGRAGGNVRAAPEALMEMTEDHFNTDEDEN